MTIEEVQRLGALDPCAVQIDKDVKELSLLNDDDTQKIAEIMKNIHISDKDITNLFGLRAADRDRAMKLFRNGHIVTRSVKICSGTTR